MGEAVLEKNMNDLILKLSSLLAFFIFTACAGHQTITGPDGSPHELISCTYGITACYEKAREMCQGDYKIMNSSSNTEGNSTGRTSTTNEILVKCKNPSFAR